MGTLAGGDENGKSNQNEPGLGRDSDTAMTDGDHASRWRFHTGVREILLPLPELLTAQEEAERVSKRIRAEEAEAKQAQQPAAREPEKPAENPTANTRHRKPMPGTVSLCVFRSRSKVAGPERRSSCSPWSWVEALSSCRSCTGVSARASQTSRLMRACKKPWRQGDAADGLSKTGLSGRLIFLH